MACKACGDAAGYCQACGGSSAREALLGVAGSRGGYWAAAVARKAPGLRGAPWPAFEGKARAIALSKVADLGGDDATREERARFCWECAKRDWERG